MAMDGRVAARWAAIDAVRVVAMVGIVAGHVWVYDQPFRDLLYSWHVPIFFLLTGYLWKPGRTLLDEARNRTRTLLVPYLAWLVILGGATLGLELMRGTVDWARAGRILWGGQYAAGPPFWTLWFVTALFFAAVIYRAMDALPLVPQWAGAIALLVVAVYVPGQPARYLPLSLGLALPGILFIVGGVTLRRYRALVTRPVLVGLVVLAISFAVIGFASSQPLDMKQLDLGTPALSAVVAITISSALILVAEGLLNGRPESVGRVVTPLAQASLTVLFLHPAVIIGLRELALPRPVIFLLTLVVVWPTGLLLLRLPHGWVLTGTRIRPRPD
jgi:acyltransferase